MSERPREAEDAVARCKALVLEFEATPKVQARAADLDRLEDALDALIDALTPEQVRRWRAWCVARRDTPGRFVPRPAPERRHPPCLGFGCEGCDGVGMPP